MVTKKKMNAAFESAVPSHWDVDSEPVHGSLNQKLVAESPNGMWLLEAHSEDGDWGVSLARLPHSETGPGRSVEHKGTKGAATPSETHHAVNSLLSTHANTGGRSQTSSPDKRRGSTGSMFDDLF